MVFFNYMMTELTCDPWGLQQSDSGRSGASSVVWQHCFRAQCPPPPYSYKGGCRVVSICLMVAAAVHFHTLRWYRCDAIAVPLQALGHQKLPREFHGTLVTCRRGPSTTLQTPFRLVQLNQPNRSAAMSTGVVKERPGLKVI